MAVNIEDARIARGMAAQLALRRARLQAGEKALGWKVGFGAPAAMERLTISAPLIGFLTDRALVPSGSTLSLSGWTKPVAEPEIAVHIGRDLEGGSDPAATRAAIAALGPAIELADLDRPPDDVQTILAGNIYQRNIVFGRRDDSRAGGSVEGLVARVVRNGNEIAHTTDLQALTGEIVGIVSHVADVLAACGERLRAGEVVIAGSIVPPLFVDAGEDIVFALEPVDTVSIRLAARPVAA